MVQLSERDISETAAVAQETAATASASLGGHPPAETDGKGGQASEGDSQVGSEDRCTVPQCLALRLKFVKH